MTIDTTQKAEDFVKNLKRSDNWVSNEELLNKLNESYKIILDNSRDDLIPFVTVNLALYYIDLGEYGQAWEFTEIAKLKAEEYKNHDCLLNSISLQFRIQLYLGNLEKSQKILNEQIETALSYNNAYQLCSAYLNQAFQYHLQHLKDDCINAFDEALKYSLKTKEFYYICMTYINFAGYLMEFNEFKRAKGNLSNGINIAKKNNYLKPLALANSNLGVLYYKQGKFSQSISHYKKAINLFNSQNNINEGIQVKMLVAEAYVKMNNYDGAEKLLFEVLNFSEQNKSKNNLSNIYQQLSNLYELQNMYKNSLLYFKKFKTINDELYNNETDKRIKNLEVIQKINLLKMERNNAQALANIKHDFLANMSHEIRTPINSVLGICYLLKQQDLNEKQHDYVNRLKQSGETLLGIINDVLDISKIESGKMDLSYDSFSLNEIINIVYDSLEPKTIEKQLGFILTKKYKNDIILKGDKVRLQQVLLNLLSNSIKFTSKGNITLNIDKKENSNKKTNIVFTVTDTGIGISKDKIDKIFERYEQANENIKNTFGGTGLGLSISKKIIELMDGTIEIKSKINKGTQFVVSVPFDITIENAVNKEYKVIDSTHLNNKTILIADDNTENRLVAKEILENFNKTLKFIEAENGQQVINILTKQKVDLLFIDLDMPILNGIETAQLIRKNKKYDSLKIIGNTASLSTFSNEDILAFGFNDFIYKPYDAQKLLKKINL